MVLNKPITICNIYIPPSYHVASQEFQNLIDQLPSPFILLGDFNAHNPLWGGNRMDSKGEMIEKIMIDNNLSLFNDGSKTFHNMHSNYSSALDLSMCTPNLFLDYCWYVDEYLHGSDHYPIYLKYIMNTPSRELPKWKPEDADWNKFMCSIKIDRNYDSFDNHIEAYNFLIDNILESANNSIPKTSGNPKRPPVPWWNEKCALLRKITRKCYRRFKTSGSSESKIAYLRNQAKQRKYFKKIKKDSWIHYINGINSKVPATQIWKKIKKLSGKYVRSPLPSLKIDNVIITNEKEVAEKLGCHFANISSAENYSEEFRQARNREIIVEIPADDQQPYNRRFTLKELNDPLTKAEPSAPGDDNILYEMLSHLPEHAKKFLLKIINAIWISGILPGSWKIALTIPIKKPHKDPYQTSSYRPIALTSCVCKIMEKMVNTRLTWYLESNNYISDFQYGFRKNRSTLDPLLNLTNDIQQGFANHKQTIGVFFDIEKAYDTVHRQLILKEFLEMNIKGNMFNFLRSFLTDRYFKVKIGNTYSELFKQEEGVPQGSILSVICFTVAINKIVKTISAPVKCALFADDLYISTSSYDAASACKYLQKTINAINKWIKQNGLKISASKTVAIRFTRSTRREDIPSLIINNEIIPYEDKIKYLGVTFDKKLTWGPHIEDLKKNATNSLNILRVVSTFNWGADKKSLLKIYDAVCRSKLDYACQVYSSACKTHLRKLDVVHNQGLRICTGAYRSSPVESIYIDSGELPLDLRRQELGLRYIQRLKSSLNNPALKVLSQCDSGKFPGVRSSKPFQTRLNEDTWDQPNIKQQKICKLTYMAVSPWFIPEINICKRKFSRKNRSTEEIRATFLNHDSIHTQCYKIYTDGSKSSSGVGAAIVSKEITSRGKLSELASVFTAEMTAINNALKNANANNCKKVVIYSDSKSAIESLRQFNPRHPLIQRAQEWIFLLHAKLREVTFCWIPAHVGLMGNEEADKEARSAAEMPQITITTIPNVDMKMSIRKYILEKWKKR